MKITLYTITDCPFCKQEKDYLTSHNAQFEEKNLETNKEFLTEMLAVSNNFAGTPVTKVEKDNGQIAVLKGFTKEEFDKELGYAADGATPAAPAAPEPKHEEPAQPMTPSSPAPMPTPVVTPESTPAVPAQAQMQNSTPPTSAPEVPSITPIVTPEPATPTTPAVADPNLQSVVNQLATQVAPQDVGNPDPTQPQPPMPEPMPPAPSPNPEPPTPGTPPVVQSTPAQPMMPAMPEPTPVHADAAPIPSTVPQPQQPDKLNSILQNLESKVNNNSAPAPTPFAQPQTPTATPSMPNIPEPDFH